MTYYECPITGIFYTRELDLDFANIEIYVYTVLCDDGEVRTYKVWEKRGLYFLPHQLEGELPERGSVDTCLRVLEKRVLDYVRMS